MVLTWNLFKVSISIGGKRLVAVSFGVKSVSNASVLWKIELPWTVITVWLEKRNELGGDELQNCRVHE